MLHNLVEFSFGLFRYPKKNDIVDCASLKMDS